MYVCPPPRLLKTIHIKGSLNSHQTSTTAFQFLCMALAINTVDGQGLSYEVRHVLLPKKSKVIFHYMIKAV